MSLPLEDAKSTTKISFRVKSYRKDATILLSAGPIDYCLITLDNGALKLRINLGSGEAVLTSKSGLKLNDLVWHQIEIERNEGELSMTVDGLHTTYLEIPGKHFELNIKYGIYVGGLGDFNELFLGNLHSFRGCIDSLRFNEINVFEEVSKSRDGVIESVSFDCSPEFDVSPNSAISFVDPSAFVVLPGFSNSRLGSTLQFHLKTISQIAILFYSCGTPTQLSDFIAVEIINGRISLSVNDGNGVVVLQSDVLVNNGEWHKVELRFSTSFLEVSVDGKSRNLRPSPGENKFYDLSDNLFVGGLDLNKQSFAFQQGLQTLLSEGTEISLKGCLKDIRVNEQKLGIREAEVSKGIKVGECLWHYPCLTESPCLSDAKCFHEGFDSFRCICANDVCSKSHNSTLNYKMDDHSSNKVTEKSTSTTVPTTAKMSTLLTEVTISNRSTPKLAEFDKETIRTRIKYLNVVITHEHLLIAAVVALILLTLIIALIVVHVSSKNNRQRMMATKSERNNKATRHCRNSDNGNDCSDAILMNSNRQISMRSAASISEIERCIASPPTSTSASTYCESVSDQHSRSVTPLKTYAMPLLSQHRLRNLSEENETRNKSSVFPLPPPSLYFGAASGIGRANSTSQWCSFHPNTLPSKLSQSSLLYSKEHNFENNIQSADPSTVRMMGDGTSDVDTPLSSLQKLPWSSEDLTELPPPLSLESRIDRCIACSSPNRNFLPKKSLYTIGTDSTRLQTFTSPDTSSLQKQRHHWL